MKGILTPSHGQQTIFDEQFVKNQDLTELKLKKKHSNISN